MGRREEGGVRRRRIADDGGRAAGWTGVALTEMKKTQGEACLEERKQKAVFGHGKLKIPVRDISNPGSREGSVLETEP